MDNRQGAQNGQQAGDHGQSQGHGNQHLQMALVHHTGNVRHDQQVGTGQAVQQVAAQRHAVQQYAALHNGAQQQYQQHQHFVGVPSHNINAQQAQLPAGTFFVSNPQGFVAPNGQPTGYNMPSNYGATPQQFLHQGPMQQVPFQQPNTTVPSQYVPSTPPATRGHGGGVPQLYRPATQGPARVAPRDAHAGLKPLRITGRPDDFINTLTINGTAAVVKVLVAPTSEYRMNRGVFKVKTLTNDKIRVEKRLESTDAKSEERIQHEIYVLQRIRLENRGRPPCLNGLRGSTCIVRSGAFTAVYLEHCSEGTLNDLINRRQDSRYGIGERWLWKVVWSLACALSWLHEGRMHPYDVPNRQNGQWDSIAHLDIKPDNVFIHLDKSEQALSQNPRGLFEIVLGDFGCAAKDGWTTTIRGLMDESHVQSTGTPGWFPPENANSPLYDRNVNPYFGSKTDIWQVGGVLQCMMTLDEFPDQEASEVTVTAFDRYSVEIVSLMRNLMDRDYHERPDAPQLGRYVGRDMESMRMPYDFGPS